MNKDEIRSLLNSHGLRPNKRFGQNFLINREMCQKITDAAQLDSQSSVLEIGPGVGCLTEILVQTEALITAVEIDNGYIPILDDLFSHHKNFRLVHADFLKFNEALAITHVVANLPYYCASELLFRVTELEPQRIVVMLQKEMAERIHAKPGSKTYGALTINLTIEYQCDQMFLVGRSNFYPRPDIDSAVIILNRKEKSLITSEQRPLFKEVVRTLFWGRRKTILKCLTSSPHLTLTKARANDVLAQAGLSPLERAENLTLEDFAALTTYIGQEI